MIKGRNKRRLMRITRRSDFTRKFLPACLILAILLTGFSRITKNITDLYQWNLSVENSNTAVFQIETGSKYPGSTETIRIKADPVKSDQTMAMIRLQLQNATVLEVTPGDFLTLGTCSEGKLFTSDTICADISNGEPFTKGDVLLSAKIKWGTNGQASILAMDGNGYYDGVNKANQNLALAVDVSGNLPFTGDETGGDLGQLITTYPAFFLLTGVILIGSVIGLMVLAVRKKDSPAWRRVSLIYSMGVILVLAGSSVFIGNYLQQNRVNPETGLAEGSLDEYTACPAPYRSGCTTGSSDVYSCLGFMARNCVPGAGGYFCMRCLNCVVDRADQPAECDSPTDGQFDPCFKNGWLQGNHCVNDTLVTCEGYKAKGDGQSCGAGLCNEATGTCNSPDVDDCSLEPNWQGAGKYCSQTYKGMLITCDANKHKTDQQNIGMNDDLVQCLYECSKSTACKEDAADNINFCKEYGWKEGVHCPTDDPFEVRCSYNTGTNGYTQILKECDELCDTGYGCDPVPNENMCMEIYSRPWSGSGRYCFSKYQVSCIDKAGGFDFELLGTFESKDACLFDCATKPDCKETATVLGDCTAVVWNGPGTYCDDEIQISCDASKNLLASMAFNTKAACLASCFNSDLCKEDIQLACTFADKATCAASCNTKVCTSSLCNNNKFRCDTEPISWCKLVKSGLPEGWYCYTEFGEPNKKVSCMQGLVQTCTACTSKNNQVPGVTCTDNDLCQSIPAADWGGAGHYCDRTSGSTLLLECDKDKNFVGSKDCGSDGCVIENPGTSDHCASATPTVTTTIKPTATTTPKPTTPPGKMACGDKKCIKDSDCETGLPNYECDEDIDDPPNNNQCVKLCPDGQTRVDACTCSGDTGAGVVCGPIDVNGDNLLNYIDFYQFVKVYNHTCSDTPPTTGCGGKDTNNDSKIDYKDFYTFTQKYHSRVSTCL